MSLSLLLRYPYPMRHTRHKFRPIEPTAGRATPLPTRGRGRGRRRSYPASRILAFVRPVLFALQGGLLTACGASVDSAALHIEQAYIKTPVPGKDLTAAYAHITNTTNHPICLAEFTADFAQSIEVHVTEQRVDRVRMQRVAQLCIEPSASIALQPGGTHFMLFDVTPLPATGSQVEIELIDTNQQRYSARFDVRAFNAPPPQS